MRRVLAVLASVVVVLLQCALLPALRPLDVVPNLALVWIVLMGLEGSASWALMLAVGVGLATDLASGVNFGLWTGLLVLAALAAGAVHRAGIELIGSLVASVMVAVGTVLMTVIVVGSLAGNLATWPWGWLAVHLLVQLVLNFILTVGLRPVVRALLGPGERPVQVG
jgi:hypothetical protein